MIHHFAIPVHQGMLKVLMGILLELGFTKLERELNEDWGKVRFVEKGGILQLTEFTDPLTSSSYKGVHIALSLPTLETLTELLDKRGIDYTCEPEADDKVFVSMPLLTPVPFEIILGA